MSIREEASGGAALGAVRLQPGWPATGDRYSAMLPGKRRYTRVAQDK